MRSKDRATREQVRTTNGLIEALVARLAMTSTHYLPGTQSPVFFARPWETKDVLRGDVKEGVQCALVPATRMLLEECGRVEAVDDVGSASPTDEFEAVRLLKHLVLFQESIVHDLANMRVFERLIEIDNELCPDLTREDIVHILEKAASWSSEA